MFLGRAIVRLVWQTGWPRAIETGGVVLRDLVGDVERDKVERLRLHEFCTEV